MAQPQGEDKDKAWEDALDQLYDELEGKNK